MGRAKTEKGKNGRSVEKKPQKRKARPRKGQGKKPRGPSYDWRVLREEFVRAEREGGQAVTLEWLAQKNGIPYNSLIHRAAEEKWQEKRASFQHDLSMLSREKAVERMAEQSAKQDAKDFELSTGIIRLADRNVKVLEEAGKGARASDLDRMASAGERAQRMHRIASGRPTPADGGGTQVSVNVYGQRGDPMEKLRRQFEASRMAGTDTRTEIREFCQLVVDEILADGSQVEIKPPQKAKKALRG